MRETKDNTQIIVQDMLSRDSHKIWSASCKICSLSQNHDRIMELVPYKEQMISATSNIELGGAVAPNSRFLQKAFKIIYFHKDNMGCPCLLLGEDANPIHCVEDGYFTLKDTVHGKDSNYVDYYILYCKRCGRLYQVDEREYHYIWWNWHVIDENKNIYGK